MNASLLTETLSVNLTFGYGMFLAVCATTNPYSLTYDAKLEDTPPPPSLMKYTIIYGDPTSTNFVQPHSNKLQAVLEELGYELADPESANVIVYVVAAMDELTSKTREQTAKESGTPTNPDSIRYKNVAAMVGGGRYKQLLNDNPNAPGDLIMGPEGEIIETGNLRTRNIATVREMVTETQRRNRLKLRVVELPLPAKLEDVQIRWQVEVVSELPLN